MLSLYWITFDRLDNMSTINIVLCHKQPQSADNEIEFDEFSATQKKKKEKIGIVQVASAMVTNI